VYCMCVYFFKEFLVSFDYFRTRRTIHSDVPDGQTLAVSRCASVRVKCLTYTVTFKSDKD
jgi:hypothetical protein